MTATKPDRMLPRILATARAIGYADAIGGDPNNEAAYPGAMNEPYVQGYAAGLRVREARAMDMIRESALRDPL